MITPLTKSAQRKLGRRISAAKRAARQEIKLVPSNVRSDTIPPGSPATPGPMRIGGNPRKNGEVSPNQYESAKPTVRK
jgi:hypothetical protein